MVILIPVKIQGPLAITGGDPIVGRTYIDVQGEAKVPGQIELTIFELW